MRVVTYECPTPMGATDLEVYVAPGGAPGTPPWGRSMEHPNPNPLIEKILGRPGRKFDRPPKGRHGRIKGFWPLFSVWREWLVTPDEAERVREAMVIAVAAAQEAMTIRAEAHGWVFVGAVDVAAVTAWDGSAESVFIGELLWSSDMTERGKALPGPVADMAEVWAGGTGAAIRSARHRALNAW